jgi:hypothetical protein
VSARADDVRHGRFALLSSAARVLEASRRQAREVTSEQEVARAISPARAHAGAPLVDRASRVRIVRLSGVVPEEVQWLWPGYLPLGKLTVLEGDPGLGKSTLAIAVAAAVSQGTALPGGRPVTPAPVVLVTYEDGLADTIRPRLDAAGADASLVYAIQGMTSSRGEPERLACFPQDAPDVFDAVRTLGARLVVIDPLSAALAGTTDSYKDADIRRALAPMSRFAEETGVAVLVIRHLTKSAGRAITSGGGSIGIAAAARCVLAVHEDPDRPGDSGARLLAVVKSNLAERPPTIAFRLASEPGQAAHIEFAGESHHTADGLAALRGDVEGGADAAREIDEWLRSYLADGAQDRREVFRQAEKSGFSARSLDRAAQRLGVHRVQSGFGKEKRSEWSLSINPAIPANTRLQARMGADEVDGAFGAAEPAVISLRIVERDDGRSGEMSL